MLGGADAKIVRIYGSSFEFGSAVLDQTTEHV